MKLKTIIETEGESLLEDQDQFSRNMSLYYAYKSKESNLPDDLKLKNADSFFGALTKQYEARVEKSALLEDIKGVLG